MLDVSDNIQYCFPNVVRLPQSVLPEENNWLCIQNAQITLAALNATDYQQSINTVQEIVTCTKKFRWYSNQVNADHGLEDFLKW